VTEVKKARLKPSDAHRWMKCPGSITLDEGLPREETSFANEGTAAHLFAEHCLTGPHRDPKVYKHFIIDVKLRSIYAMGPEPDGMRYFAVDAEMIDGVQIYLDEVARIAAEPGCEYEVEERLSVAEFADSVTSGLGDFVAYIPAPRKVVVIDFKYGRGITVDAAENEQLLTYALAIASRYHNRGVDEIEVIVVQPRVSSRPSRWTLESDDLLAHAMALRAAANRIADGDTTLNPGSWCKFCRRAPACKALADTVYQLVGASWQDSEIFSMADPAKYSPEELAAKLKAAPLIATWVKAVEAFAHAEALRGRVPPGFKLVEKKAHRRWRNAKEAAGVLTMEHGLDPKEIFTEPELLSPAKIEKMIPPKERKAAMDELAVKPMGGVVLAPIDDKRPAADVNQASGFEAVEIEER
jgi:hypothetical protein